MPDSTTAATPDAMAEALAGVCVTIDGVRYVPIDMAAVTFDNTIYLENIIVEAGLDEPGRLMTREAEAKQNAKALLRALYRSKRVTDFLAGLFVPDGEPWTEAGAIVAARRFGASTDPAVKTVLQGVLAAALMGFFSAGLTSLGISPSASTKTMAPSESGPNAAHTGSATTEASSGDSRATTRARSRPSVLGQSVKG